MNLETSAIEVIEEVYRLLLENDDGSMSCRQYSRIIKYAERVNCNFGELISSADAGRGMTIFLIVLFPYLRSKFDKETLLTILDMGKQFPRTAAYITTVVDDVPADILEEAKLNANPDMEWILSHTKDRFFGGPWS